MSIVRLDEAVILDKAVLRQQRHEEEQVLQAEESVRLVAFLNAEAEIRRRAMDGTA